MWNRLSNCSIEFQRPFELKELDVITKARKREVEKMTSKEKLNALRDHLFAEICWRYDRDEQFRVKFGGIMRTNEDFLKYIDGAYGFDVIAKDLDRLEKYDKAKELIKKKYVDIQELLHIRNKYLKEIWLTAYNSNKSSSNQLTQEEFKIIAEVFRG